LQDTDERHVRGGHWVIAQPLVPHPGEMSATAIIVKTSPLRFMKATPIPPRANERRLIPCRQRAKRKPEPVATHFSGAGMRERAAQAATR
jgi:hypothetical protein